VAQSELKTLSPLEQLWKRLRDAAKTALINHKNVELVELIGAGPSIRARARLALVAAFLIAAPTLYIGVLRTTDVSDYAKDFGVYDHFWHRISEMRFAIDQERVLLWRLEAEPDIENERALFKTQAVVRDRFMAMQKAKPADYDAASIMALQELLQRAENAVERDLKHLPHEGPVAQVRRAMTLAHLSLVTLATDVSAMEAAIAAISEKRQQAAMTTLASVARDQLILFLVLLFAIIVFVGFVPRWLVAPLMRLKRVEQQIENGNIRSLAVSGRDEVSQLARALQDALVWRDELDKKKSAKIFEVRNVLRAVITHIKEPVLILSREKKVNYANTAIATAIGIETHHLEGRFLDAYIHSAELSDLIDNALDGDVSREPIPVELKISDGKTLKLKAMVANVRDREGGVSRIVAVFYPWLQQNPSTGIEK
jgi:PAS domain-containing protein